jgi:DNA invertase Pin-like site-specific DNA recombinase
MGDNMLIGYARVSTIDQNPQLQIEALEAAGCERVFVDHGVSGSHAKRPELKKALSTLGSGDVLVVWKLDRLGRSVTDLVRIISELAERDVQFRSLTEAMDTTTATGRLLFHMVGALAEFERSLAIERTRAALVSAKKNGTKLGRKPKMTHQQIVHAKKLLEEGELSQKVARSFGVGKATLYRHLQNVHWKN